MKKPSFIIGKKQIILSALVLALSLTACGGKTGPEGVVGQFCKGLQELDEKAIAGLFGC